MIHTNRKPNVKFVINPQFFLFSNTDILCQWGVRPGQLSHLWRLLSHGRRVYQNGQHGYCSFFVLRGKIKPMSMFLTQRFLKICLSLIYPVTNLLLSVLKVTRIWHLYLTKLVQTQTEKAQDPDGVSEPSYGTSCHTCTRTTRTVWPTAAPTDRKVTSVIHHLLRPSRSGGDAMGVTAEEIRSTELYLAPLSCCAIRKLNPRFTLARLRLTGDRRWHISGCAASAPLPPRRSCWPTYDAKLVILLLFNIRIVNSKSE